MEKNWPENPGLQEVEFVGYDFRRTKRDGLREKVSDPCAGWIVLQGGGTRGGGKGFKKTVDTIRGRGKAQNRGMVFSYVNHGGWVEVICPTYRVRNSTTRKGPRGYIDPSPWTPTNLGTLGFPPRPSRVLRRRRGTMVLRAGGVGERRATVRGTSEGRRTPTPATRHPSPGLGPRVSSPLRLPAYPFPATFLPNVRLPLVAEKTGVWSLVLRSYLKRLEGRDKPRWNSVLPEVH